MTTLSHPTFRRPVRVLTVLGLLGLASATLAVAFGSFGGFSRLELLAVAAVHAAAAGPLAIAWSRGTRIGAAVLSASGVLVALSTLPDSVAYFLDPSAGLVPLEVAIVAVPLRLGLLGAYLASLIDLTHAWPASAAAPAHQGAFS